MSRDPKEAGRPECEDLGKAWKKWEGPVQRPWGSVHSVFDMLCRVKWQPVELVERG